MDAFIDMDIVELEILMERQGIAPETTMFSGETMFTPELFLSHNSNDAYTNNFDAFEQAWLDTVLAPDTADDVAVAADKSTALFNGDDDDANGPGSENYEIIVNGTLAGDTADDNGWNFTKFWSTDGISSLPLSGSNQIILTLPEGARLYDANGDEVPTIEQEDGPSIFSGDDNNGAVGIADTIEGGTIVLSDGEMIEIPWWACC